MLDAYIIDRIRREQERAQRENAQIPLHIDQPPVDPDEEQRRRERRDREREGDGSVVIDFHV
jgi:hypothetical protein